MGGWVGGPRVFDLRHSFVEGARCKHRGTIHTEMAVLLWALTIACTIREGEPGCVTVNSFSTAVSYVVL